MREMRSLCLSVSVRREAPSCSSPDRQVGVENQKNIEARRADMIISVLRTSFDYLNNVTPT